LIGDIASSLDSDVKSVVYLIHSAARSGAEAPKFQHFKASSILSDSGFRPLTGTLADIVVFILNCHKHIHAGERVIIFSDDVQTSEQY